MKSKNLFITLIYIYIGTLPLDVHVARTWLNINLQLAAIYKTKYAKFIVKLIKHSTTI